MKKYFKLVDKTNAIYCYDDGYTNIFLEHSGLIAYGENGIIFLVKF